MKISYTYSAEKELIEFHDRQQKMLEELIERKKYVYGDDVLEITASDIKEASNYIKAAPPLNRIHLIAITSKVYMSLGVLTMLGAFSYPYLTDLLKENSEQLAIFGIGLLMALVGFIASQVATIRNQRSKSHGEYLNVREFLIDPENWEISSKNIKEHEKSERNTQ